jgi:hypothetical protein
MMFPYIVCVGTAIIVATLILIGIANVMVVNDCLSRGRQPETPFLTTVCR